MARFAKVEYDKDHDILYVGYDREVSDSLRVDKFIIDFGKTDEMVGLEVFNASKVIDGLNQTKLTQKMIGELSVAKISTYRSGELMYFVVRLWVDQKQRAAPIVLQVPNPIFRAS